MGLVNLRGKIKYDISEESTLKNTDAPDFMTVREFLQGVGALYGHDFSHFNDDKLVSFFDYLSRYLKNEEAREEEQYLQDVPEEDDYEDLSESEIAQKKLQERQLAPIVEDIAGKMTDSSEEVSKGSKFVRFLRDHLIHETQDGTLSKESLGDVLGSDSWKNGYYFMDPNKAEDIKIPMENNVDISLKDLKTNIVVGKTEARKLLFDNGGLEGKLKQLNDEKVFGNSSSFNKILEASKVYAKTPKGKDKEFGKLTEEQKKALQQLKMACDDYLDAKDKQHGFNATYESIANGEMPKFKTEGGRIRYQEISELSKLIGAQLDKLPVTKRDQHLEDEKNKKKEIGMTQVQTKDKSKEKKLEMGVLQ